MGKFLDLKHIDTSVEGLDKRKTRPRNDFDPTHTIGWPGSKDHQNKADIFLSKQVFYTWSTSAEKQHTIWKY